MNPALVIVAAFLTLAAPITVALSAGPRMGQPVAVILPPWVDADTLIARAGGQPVGPVSGPFAILAQSADPRFVNRLHANGAWAVRDAGRLAQLCGTL